VHRAEQVIITDLSWYVVWCGQCQCNHVDVKCCKGLMNLFLYQGNALAHDYIIIIS